MIKLALIGQHIEHSKSPQLFAAAYHNIQRYSYKRIPATTVGKAMRLFHSIPLHGINVTAPYKRTILNYIDQYSEEVELVGAANVIVRRNDKIVAYNTDVAGVTDAFIQNGVAIYGKKALVFGAGGAGHAAAYALKKGGARVFWTNRTTAGMKNRAQQYKVHCISFGEIAEHIAKMDLIVNTLPPTAGILHTLSLHEAQVVLDADYEYNPLEKIAAAGHARYINGLSWLLWQAVPSFFYFTGIMPDTNAMRRTLLDEN
ncbi:MAG: hypothetical protein LBS12_07975 [Prevotellaceae bacterium]|jgi:shikimate dehydrogenase|nr:hypothetical protein [Prevotellaceae bacterium]